MEQFDLDRENVRPATTLEDLFTGYAEEQDSEVLSQEMLFESTPPNGLIAYPVDDEYDPIETIEVYEYKINLANGEIYRVTVHGVVGVTEGLDDGRYGPVVGKFIQINEYLEN